MYKILSILLLICNIPVNVSAQIIPGDGSSLHYRVIGFSVTATGDAGGYTLEIASGNCTTNESFKKNIISSVQSKSNKIIAEVPAFGSQYTWRMVPVKANNNTTLTTGSLHHFSTLSVPNADQNSMRVRILKQADKYKDAMVFFDGNRGLYDMKGNPVWFLPDLNGENDGNSVLSDLKLSPTGTITFLLNSNAYEINYNGTILWKAPNNGAVSGEDAEHYHHEFTKLGNGNYMALGTHMGDMKKTEREPDSPPTPDKMPFGTLIEYDKQGKIVWTWKAGTYFYNSDFQYYKRYTKENIAMPVLDPHENGFYFDEQNKNIYISCKNISRILKVKYPSGEVLNGYGAVYKKGTRPEDNGLFCHQHSSRTSQKGYLYVFNNNTCLMQPNTPKITVMQEPGVANESNLKKVWEYDFRTVGGYEPMMSGGGNVIELPDQSMFVCMGHQYGATMIIGMDKKTYWSALPEKWLAEEKRWVFAPQYRASIITDRKGFEQLVWNNEQPAVK